MAYPGEEITVAGNPKEILLGIERIGNDLTFRNSVVAPTIKIRRMTVADHSPLPDCRRMYPGKITALWRVAYRNTGQARAIMQLR